MILQLQKTSPFITGQQRFDVVLKLHTDDNGAIHLIDDSIHIVPLSDNVIYNENQKRPPYNYTQKENIKYLYEQTHQTFYDAVTEHGVNLVWSENPVDTNDHTYQAGLKRIRFSRYGKPFSFLCPVWIDTEWDDSFAFRFSIRHKDSQQWLTKRVFKPSDELKAYLKDWFAGNSDELLNINTSKNLATVKGCSVVSGADSIVDISYIIKNILTRERPLMEFDSILCDTFRQNSLIAKQMFNFNFCFDFSDILGVYAAANIGAQPLNVQVEFGTFNGAFTPFEKRDLYTNYEYIPKYSIQSEGYTQDNVLDYLNDNLCVDNIYANKMVQPIFHWALADNPNYLYNFYNGFSPEYGSDEVSGMYYGTPMVGYSKYDEKLCNLNWVRTAFDMTISDYEYQVKYPDEYYTKLPENDDLNSDSFWMDWLKYKVFEDENVPGKPAINPSSIKYFKIAYCDNIPNIGNKDVTLNIYTKKNGTLITTLSNNLKAAIGGPDQQNQNVLTLFVDKNNMGIISLDWFAIGQNYYYFEFIYDNDPDSEFSKVLNWIFQIKNNVIPPEKFVYDKGIIPVKADKTLTNSREIRFLKANRNSTVTLHRYTGHLIPMFIPGGIRMCNWDWRPKQFKKVGDTVAKTINKAYVNKKKLDFPSLGWFTLENDFTPDANNPIPRTHYDSLPDVMPQQAADWFKDVCTDLCWYDASYGLNLPSQWSTIYTADGDNDPYLDDVVAESLLKAYLNVPFIGDDEFHSCVWNLYTYTFDFDYTNNQNIKDIEYHITYNLR